MNPCCCMSLQRGVSVLAIIDAVLNVILVALWGLLLGGVIAIDPKNHEDITESDKVTVIVVCVLYIFAGIFQICIAIYLRKAARKSNLRGCMIWLWITGCLLLLGAISFIVEFTATRAPLNLTSGILGILYKLYEMWVVFSFVQELRSQMVPGAL